ncbi:MAG: hypothetical protein HKN51_16155 [Saprospiraceae bacterium]|nr:hypothetical protein [Saprospiraceae bacterium]
MLILIFIIFGKLSLSSQFAFIDELLIQEELDGIETKEKEYLITQDYKLIDSCIIHEDLSGWDTKYDKLNEAKIRRTYYLNAEDCKYRKTEFTNDIERAKYSKNFLENKKYYEYFIPKRNSIFYDPHILFSVNIFNEYYFQPKTSLNYIYPGELSSGIYLLERVPNAFRIYGKFNLVGKFYGKGILLSEYTFKKSISRELLYDLIDQGLDEFIIQISNRFNDKMEMKFILKN